MKKHYAVVEAIKKKQLENEKGETVFFIKEEGFSLDELKARAIQYGFDANWNSSIGLLANNNRDNSDVAAIGFAHKKAMIKGIAAKGAGNVDYVPLERTNVVVDGKVIGRRVKIDRNVLLKMENMYKNLNLSSVTDELVELFFEDYDMFVDAGGQFRIDSAKKSLDFPVEFLYEGVVSG